MIQALKLDNLDDRSSRGGGMESNEDPSSMKLLHLRLKKLHQTSRHFRPGFLERTRRLLLQGRLGRIWALDLLTAEGSALYP